MKPTFGPARLRMVEAMREEGFLITRHFDDFLFSGYGCNALCKNPGKGLDKIINRLKKANSLEGLEKALKIKSRYQNGIYLQ